MSKEKEEEDRQTNEKNLFSSYASSDGMNNSSNYNDSFTNTTTTNNDNDNFLAALRGMQNDNNNNNNNTSSGISSQTTTSDNNDAFLTAVRGMNKNNNNDTSTTRTATTDTISTNADDDFLAAVRGMNSKPTYNNYNNNDSITTDDDFLAAVRGMNNKTNIQKKKKTDSIGNDEFLAALRGSSSYDDTTTTTTTTQVKNNDDDDFLAAVGGIQKTNITTTTTATQKNSSNNDNDAFLAAVRGSSSSNDNNDTTTSPAKSNNNTNDDDDFLAAVRGIQKTNTTTNQNNKSSNDNNADADNAFLAALRGNNNDNTTNNSKSINADDDFLAAVRGMNNQTKASNTKNKTNIIDDNDDADGSFLAAIRATQNRSNSISVNDDTGNNQYNSADNAFLAAARGGGGGGGGGVESSGITSDPNAAFLAAVGGSNFDPSGSFAFSSVTKNKKNEAERSNLSAAAAALAKDGNKNNNKDNAAMHSTGNKANHINNTAPPEIPAPQEPKKDDDVLFMEEVVMPRPLFFGAVLPPRVIEYAKAAIKEHENKPLEELPGSVRNLIGALRTYGYGILDKNTTSKRNSIFGTSSYDSDEDGPATTNNNTMETKIDWRGNGTVRCFQPCWTKEIRNERRLDFLEKREKTKQRPSVVSRSMTAPPRMVDIDEDDDDSEIVQQMAGVILEEVKEEEEGEEENEQNQMSSSSLVSPNKNDQFSMWLRADDNSAADGNASNDSMSLGEVHADKEPEEKTLPPKELSEQEKFSQWALGSSSDFRHHGETPTAATAGTFQFTSPFGQNNNMGTFVPNNAGTLINTKSSNNNNKSGNGSDDDSVYNDEQKTQVGANENLSKALALLADDEEQPADGVPSNEQTQLLLSQVAQVGTKKRPLTNYEFTCGCVPLFGADDAPLPSEADLGNHETKEEQQRAFEQKRSQEMIEQFVQPNIFGSISCPNPAVSPDDFHSWNARTIVPQRMTTITSSATIASDPVGLRRGNFNTISSDPLDRNAPPPKPPKHHRGKKQQSSPSKQSSKSHINTSRQRVGWWNEPVGEEGTSNKKDEVMKDGEEKKEEDSVTTLQLPPTHHSSSTLQVVTQLEPKPGQLCDDNLPLSRMHAATTMAQSLPYLSDRPPSHRYLQIDTQAIAFPPIKEEIEPFFCSMALYNVETISSGLSTGAKNAAPIPDLQRCGRVTESLQFDHVIDADVETRCSGSLWPYASKEPARGTRCGVFPIPSNLNIANLYAVLIVKKVVGEDTDFDPYLKPGKAISDLEKLKGNAERSSNRYGNFLAPFAFGVAPLLQVFGADNPSVATSRAVQIPLFHFAGGERQIIDHIMVMLFPRADHKANGVGGPAPVTNGGTAMLVMRNFGYLGLHAVVDSKSSLARDRLVDFTGELQVRRRTDEDSKQQDKQQLEPFDSFRTELSQWHPNYLAEPTVGGGRSISKPESGAEVNSVSTSNLYAQEVVPIPLLLSSSSRITGGTPTSRGRGSQEDIEPTYFTSFCNELLCHPRILHNCSKSKVAIKLELRAMEWNVTLGVYFAHLPNDRIGPSIHNNRRGPFLVQSAFTSCSLRRGENHLIDEFKIKLPLELNAANAEKKPITLSIFFTVYKIRSGTKGNWKRGAKKLFGSTASDSFGNVEGAENADRVDHLACGFLPLTSNSCILENGIHDVRIVYTARTPSEALVKQGVLPASSLILVERTTPEDAVQTGGREESCAEDTTMSNDSLKSDRNREIDSSMRTDSNSDLQSMNDDSVARSTKSSKSSQPMSLSVRILVYSSVHSPNIIVNRLLQEEVDTPLLASLPNKAFISSLRMGKEFLLKSTQSLEIPKQTVDSHEKLLEATISVADHQLCSVANSTWHLCRIVSLLWRAFICGKGKPDLVWTNPAASLPLRVHSFATILHLVGASSLYLSKHGVTQVDGNVKWSVAVLGRILALLFDEEKLFGEQAKEKFDEKHWESERQKNVPGAPVTKRSPMRRPIRHIRQTFELGNDMRKHGVPASDVANFASNAGDLATIPKPRHANPSKPVALDLDFKDLFKSPDSTDNPESPADKKEVKVDTKSDFQSFLRAANAAVDESSDISVTDSANASNGSKELARVFGGISSGGRSRYNTAPPSTLATIMETDHDSNNFNESTDLNFDQEEIMPAVNVVLDENESNIVKMPQRSSAQMRRPRVRRKENNTEEDKEKPESSKKEHSTLTDDQLDTMGDAILEQLEKDILSSFTPSVLHGEEKQVGSSHHRRKTQGRSSIDWSLNWEDRPSPTPSPTPENSVSSAELTVEENTEHLSTLKNEECLAVNLPSFIDRLEVIGDTSAETSRWFPFTYEVVIMQWAALLLEQRNAGDRTINGMAEKGSSEATQRELARAASRSIGVAVASAPMLFEVIKQSLGYRIKTLFNDQLARANNRSTPPLIRLDETLMTNLTHVITMVADACMDSRNFDTWDLRQMSIDVNDSVIKFLRDLFSFLAPSCVHRLFLAYLSRFLTKEGKHYTDRDSQIGLRCPWEITKLRLNAITAVVRFPDFIKVNGPQMLNWDNWWTTSPSRSTSKFYDDILKRYKSYQLPDYAHRDKANTMKDLFFPAMTPHWLAEVVVDICLLGTEHAEHYIQHRAASLLHELFWSCSQDSIYHGISAPVAGMFISFIEKLIANVDYFSNFSPKSQLRKDVLLCGVYVLQSAPTNLLRALWRNLCSRLPGKSGDRRYANFGPDGPQQISYKVQTAANNVVDLPDVLGMISLLNLSLQTVEYEGCDENIEGDNCAELKESVEVWRKEYLLSRKESKGDSRLTDSSRDGRKSGFSSSISRKWQAHDGSMVVINAGHQIVREMYNILSKSHCGDFLLNPSVRRSRQKEQNESSRSRSLQDMSFLGVSRADTVLFIRAVTSLYLQALALRQSDIVLAKSFVYSCEVIKIFGIELFLEAVGETLQHWMRVISFHCGARRSQVRIEATDLLELILRSTWEGYGTFFRIRVPLLAVQTEVMERIVAIAAARFYRDQRRMSSSESFTNVAAEASLVPLWRTLDRVENRPASQNVAFRGALVRIAVKLKKLYRAYVAARALSFMRNTREKPPVNEISAERDFEADARIRANRINILRVINASEGFSKQFLGFQGTTQHRSSVAHFEAVEDALIEAADVFSPTELPEHRVAWLRMLAEFHNRRNNYAEEATCHYYIHVTLHQAARLHGSLWSNTPFLPWTDNIPDPVAYIDGDTAPDGGFSSDLNFDGNDWDEYREAENVNSFRRIFYRVANSLAIGVNGWEPESTKNLFFGICSLLEYYTVNPWISLREMEENMIEEVEASGLCFLHSGIVQNCRFAWNLATHYYSEKYNYGKLALAYANLSTAVVSQIPPIDTSLPHEVISTHGRFYRVWFHGGAPDELSGVEFVYRAQGTVGLKEFGEQLREVIKSIIPTKTPIHLLLDGLSEDKEDDSSAMYSGFRIGPAPLEPVRIKVTPLRPLFGRDTRTRGRAEWFHHYVEENFSGPVHRTRSDLNKRGPLRWINEYSDAAADGADPHHQHSRSFSATVFSSTGSSSGTTSGRRTTSLIGHGLDRAQSVSAPRETDLSGVEKFCFVQPKNKSRPKEWWKTSSGDFAEKSLRVTQIQVGEMFPACVTRQKVAHRLVFLQSPLEAGIDAVCQWCAVLFRTAMAVNGMAVLKTNYDPGIGTDASKVVADAIHNSHVKEIGLSFLKIAPDLSEADFSTEFGGGNDSGRLSDEEIGKFQVKLARLIVAFVELLHLLIARNRDMLLDVIQERKKNDNGFASQAGSHRGHRPTSSSTVDGSVYKGAAHSVAHSLPAYTTDIASGGKHKRRPSEGYRSDDGRTTGSRGYNHSHVGSEDNQSYHSMMTTPGVRTDSAIAVQSELQRAFISLTKSLYKNVNIILRDDTPRWFKQCSQDNYFSLGTYRQTKVPIAEELCFTAPQSTQGSQRGSNVPQSIHSEHGNESPRNGSIGGGSQGSVISRGSERYGFGQF